MQPPGLSERLHHLFFCTEVNVKTFQLYRIGGSRSSLKPVTPGSEITSLVVRTSGGAISLCKWHVHKLFRRLEQRLCTERNTANLHLEAQAMNVDTSRIFMDMMPRTAHVMFHTCAVWQSLFNQWHTAAVWESSRGEVLTSRGVVELLEA